MAVRIISFALFQGCRAIASVENSAADHGPVLSVLQLTHRWIRVSGDRPPPRLSQPQSGVLGRRHRVASVLRRVGQQTTVGAQQLEVRQRRPGSAQERVVALQIMKPIESPSRGPRLPVAAAVHDDVSEWVTAFAPAGPRMCGRGRQIAMCIWSRSSALRGPLAMGCARPRRLGTGALFSANERVEPDESLLGPANVTAPSLGRRCSGTGRPHLGRPTRFARHRSDLPPSRPARKRSSTVDVLSGGRAGLGIGVALFEREHRGLGVPFPPIGERFERLEETLQICAQMWDPHNNGPFAGKHYHLAETLCSPQPIHRPPVLVGGGGERKTLRLVAQYGDVCNLITASPEDVAHKLDVLRRHCDAVGRDYDQIRKTIQPINPRPTPDTRDEFVRDMAAYAALGVHSAIVTPTSGSPARWIAGMAPAIPLLVDLG